MVSNLTTTQLLEIKRSLVTMSPEEKAALAASLKKPADRVESVPGDLLDVNAEVEAPATEVFQSGKPLVEPIAEVPQVSVAEHGPVVPAEAAPPAVAETEKPLTKPSEVESPVIEKPLAEPANIEPQEVAIQQSKDEIAAGVLPEIVAAEKEVAKIVETAVPEVKAEEAIEAEEVQEPATDTVPPTAAEQHDKFMEGPDDTNASEAAGLEERVLAFNPKTGEME